MNPYLPNTTAERDAMLRAIGVDSFDELTAGIPPEIRNPALTFPEPVSEMELVREIEQLAEKNTATSTHRSFLGAGTYEHYIPAVVPALALRGEFFTAYTPYQAEASQGTLQVIYEYQSMMARLSGLAVSTASHYDGATSLAESVLIALEQTRRKKVVIAAAVHPEYRTVLKTYLSAQDVEIVEMAADCNGRCAGTAVDTIDKETACVVLQSPNMFGIIEDMSAVRPACDAAKALFILVANPLSFAVVRSAGEWGAHIACGDAQVFGNPISFGGPHLGYITATKEFMRKLPGRLAGMTVDHEGKRAFVLTLQAREQHIRRERASSNICSNQALCALQACIYLAAVGERGLRRIAEINMQNLQYFKEKVKNVRGVELVFDAPQFNECVIRTKQPVADVITAGKKKGIFPGVPLERWYPELTNTLLVCITETKTKNDIDALVESIK